MNFKKLIAKLLPIFYSPPPQAVAAREPTAPASEPPPAHTQRSPYFSLGCEMAIATRAQKPDMAYLKLLEEQVEAQAGTQGVIRFDHSIYPGDKRKLETLKALDEQSETLHDQYGMAAAELLDRDNEVAKLGGLRPRRAATPEFRTLAAVALNISIAPTLVMFFGGLFALLKWVLAIGFGFSISMMIVAAILPDDPQGDSQQNKEIQ